MKAKKKLTLRTKRSITGYLFILPFIIGFLLFILSPLISSIQMSFSEVTISTTGVGFNMKNIGFNNFIRAFTIDPDFNRLLVNSIKDMLINVPCIIIFSLIAAVLLNRKFPGRGFVRAIFFLPVILNSGIVLGLEKTNALLLGIESLQSSSIDTSITTVAQNLLLGALGGAASTIVDFVVNVVNRFYDIVTASGIQTVIFLSALQTINTSVYEAADIEGCTAWEKLWKITIPMVSPMILVNWIYTIVDRFLRTDNELMTKILAAASASLEYGYSSAMAWVYCIIMVAFIGLSAFIISKVVYYYD